LTDFRHFSKIRYGNLTQKVEHSHTKTTGFMVWLRSFYKLADKTAQAGGSAMYEDIMDKERHGESLLTHLCALFAIPRASGNEGGAVAYAIHHALKREWSVFFQFLGIDASGRLNGNVILQVPPTPGYEHKPVVVLQAHLDIVGEKSAKSTHDFLTDPIPAYLDAEGYIRSRNASTTLGVDNGWGVAAALAAGDDASYIHGPLELLFTISEETGMDGAFAVHKEMLKGRILLNLDSGSEKECIFFVGCAGGGNTTITIPLLYKTVPVGYKPIRVKVQNFRGGHSGVDIHLHRQNAIKVLAKLITAAYYHKPKDAMISFCKGGSKNNAIPREAEAEIWVLDDSNYEKKIVQCWNEMSINPDDCAKDEAGQTIAPSVSIENISFEKATQPLSNSCDILCLLNSLPHGWMVMSRDIPGKVETSTNLAILNCEGDKLTILCSTRSFKSDQRDTLRVDIQCLGEIAGGHAEQNCEYPNWAPNLASPILNMAKIVYKRINNKEPEVTAVHAGLECGVIRDLVPGIDSLSFGPHMMDEHTPNENHLVASGQRSFDFLKALLNAVAMDQLQPRA